MAVDFFLFLLLKRLNHAWSNENHTLKQTRQSSPVDDRISPCWLHPFAWYTISYSQPNCWAYRQKQGPTQHWPMAHQILNNSFCVMSQSWDSNEKVMRQSWDSHDTVMRQSWNSLQLYSSCRLCGHVCSRLVYEMVSESVTFQQVGHMTMTLIKKSGSKL